MYRTLIRVRGLILFLLVTMGTAHAMHNANRYFPLLERLEPLTLPPFGKLNVDLFIAQAGSAFDSGIPGSGGIPEIAGQYDLDLVLQSIQKSSLNSDGSFIHPFCQSRPDLIGCPLIFNQKGRLQANGLAMQYTQSVHLLGLALGAYLPYAQVCNTLRARFNRAQSPAFADATQTQIDEYDTLARQSHERVGLRGSDFARWGFGDLDLYARQYNVWHHRLLMHALYLNLQAGLLVPTSKSRAITYPAALPFGCNGSYAFYGDLWLDLELRRDWHLGVVGSLSAQTTHTRKERVPLAGRAYVDFESGKQRIFSEPIPYSAQVGTVSTSPGLTHKFKVYAKVDHLTDGLSFMVGFTRLRHQKDSLSATLPAQLLLSTSPCLVQARKLSSWYASYLNLQLNYDTRDSGKHWFGQPLCYLVADFPVERFGGKRAAKTTQFTLGVAFRF